MLHSVLNWRLTRSPNQCPGPEGDTTLTEAALIAAGLPFQSEDVGSRGATCFSPVIADYVHGLNYWMPEKFIYERLFPFVVRLVGTRDEDNEAKRATHIAINVPKRLLVFSAYRCSDKTQHEHVHAYRKVETLADAVAALSLHGSKCIDYYASNDPITAAQLAIGSMESCGQTMGGWDADVTDGGIKQYWFAAIEILDEAIKLGREEPIDIMLAAQRLGEMKRLVRLIRADFKPPNKPTLSVASG